MTPSPPRRTARLPGKLASSAASLSPRCFQTPIACRQACQNHREDGNSGNKFSSNYANGNAFGFDSDDTSGADAVPNSGANSFEKNHAIGNTQYDFVDATYGYTGPDTSTNAATADYYKGNKGSTALPASILHH